MPSSMQPNAIELRISHRIASQHTTLHTISILISVSLVLGLVGSVLYAFVRLEWNFHRVSVHTHTSPRRKLTATMQHQLHRPYTKATSRVFCAKPRLWHSTQPHLNIAHRTTGAQPSAHHRSLIISENHSNSSRGEWSTTRLRPDSARRTSARASNSHHIFVQLKLTARFVQNCGNCRGDWDGGKYALAPVAPVARHQNTDTHDTKKHRVLE